MELIEKIYYSVLNFLNHAEKENVFTHGVALQLVKSRVDGIAKVKLGR